MKKRTVRANCDNWSPTAAWTANMKGIGREGIFSSRMKSTSTTGYMYFKKHQGVTGQREESSRPNKHG